MTLLNFQLRSPATLLVMGTLFITVGLLGLLYSTHNGWGYPLSGGVLLSIIGLHRLGRKGADQHLLSAPTLSPLPDGER